MKKIIICFLALTVSLFFAGFTCFALPLDELADRQVRDELIRGKILSGASFDKFDSRLIQRLMPNYIPLRQLFGKSIAELDPSMLVENLYLYKKPPNFRNRLWTEAEKTAVLNALVSISQLAGVQYYSASRNSMRVFYETSSVIDDPQKKTPQADPAFTLGETAPPKISLYARQKDLTFGDNIYRYDYAIDDSAVMFKQTNYSTLYYGIIPVIAKGKLCTIAAVIDAEEYFLIYAVSMAKAPSIPAINKKAGSSFASRAEALIKWFTSSIAGD
ncbi:MAG: hypothetical protein LBB22_02435 [Treponema sp.]|jgi:hypothetical protein|nr:hypothetical protein [Treponema sp.]